MVLPFVHYTPPGRAAELPYLTDDDRRLAYRCKVFGETVCGSSRRAVTGANHRKHQEGNTSQDKK